MYRRMSSRLTLTCGTVGLPRKIYEEGTGMVVLGGMDPKGGALQRTGMVSNTIGLLRVGVPGRPFGT